MTPSEQSRRNKYGQQAKEYLSEKVPKERREQAIWRLKKMVIEIQGHSDCKCPRCNLRRIIANPSYRPGSH